MYFKFFLKNMDQYENISLTDLSEKVQIKFSTLESYIFRDISPSYQNIKKIADYFGLSLDYLILGEKSKYIKNIRLFRLAEMLDKLPYQQTNKIEIYIDTFLDLRKKIERQFDTDPDNEQEIPNYDFTNNFNLNLKQLLEKNEITVRDFAKSMNLTEHKINNYKRKTECSYDTLIKISNKYHISIHWILTGQKINFDFRNKEFLEIMFKADSNLEKKYLDMTIEFMERILKENQVEIPA